MPAPFRVLIIDDSEQDAHLIARTLRKQWPKLIFKRVETEAAVRQALREHTWSCMICDVIVPGFSASQALEIITQSKLYLPFIIISGKVAIQGHNQAAQGRCA